MRERAPENGVNHIKRLEIATHISFLQEYYELSQILTFTLCDSLLVEARIFHNSPV